MHQLIILANAVLANSDPHAAPPALTDVKPGLVFWTWITFLIVFFILRQFAWGPMLKAISDREKNIVNAIESAKHERAEAEKLVAEQKSAVAQARQEAAEQVRKTQADLEKFREELMAKARKDAEDFKTEARRGIEEERVKAVNDIKNEAVKLSLFAAEKLLAEKMDDPKHQQLAQQFVSELAAKKAPN